MTNKELIAKIKEFAGKKDLSKEEWKEYEKLVRLQYKNGANDPEPITEEKQGDE